MLKEKKELSRRDALIGMGKIAAGAVIVSAGTSALITPAKAKTAQFPWGYKKLDLQEVGDIAYNAWYGKYCCQAVVEGLLKPLQKSMGEPYASLPLDAFKWGHGGAVGWGTLCGTMTGAGIATGFIAGPEGEKILNDVIAWYSNTTLPIYIFSSIRRGITPEVNAIGTMVLAGSLILLLTAQFLLRARSARSRD